MLHHNGSGRRKDSHRGSPIEHERVRPSPGSADCGGEFRQKRDVRPRPTAAEDANEARAKRSESNPPALARYRDRGKRP